MKRIGVNDVIVFTYPVSMPVEEDVLEMCWGTPEARCGDPWKLVLTTTEKNLLRSLPKARSVDLRKEDCKNLLEGKPKIYIFRAPERLPPPLASCWNCPRKRGGSGVRLIDGRWALHVLSCTCEQTNTGPTPASCSWKERDGTT